MTYDDVIRDRHARQLLPAVCVFLSVLASAGAVEAAEASGKLEAKAYFRAGQSHYNLNEFTDALVEFKEAYRLFPDPAFLFNAAQCERQLGHQEEAIQFYRSYMRSAPKAPNRQEVEHRIDELQAAFGAKKSAWPATLVEPPTLALVPATTPSPPAEVPASTPTASAPEPAAAVVTPSATRVSVPPATPVTSDPAETRADLVSTPASLAISENPAFYQRWWFWTGVAVVAAGVGVGAYMLSAGGGNSAGPSSQLGAKNAF